MCQAGLSRSMARNADLSNHLLHLEGRWLSETRDGESHGEVEEHPDRADALWRNVEQVLGRCPPRKLKYTMYEAVNMSPTTMPATTPSRLALLEKIPRVMAGKNEAAASPKANATTCATKPGGLIPK